MLTPFYFSMNFIVMELSALTAISPLDGRYGRQTAELRDIFSEFALMRARVTVEIEWLIALSEFNLPELKDLSEEDKLYLRGLVSSFSVAAKRLKTSKKLPTMTLKRLSTGSRAR